MILRLTFCHSVPLQCYGAPFLRQHLLLCEQELFYDKMLADPRISYFFDGIDMRKQRAHQVVHQPTSATAYMPVTALLFPVIWWG